MGPLEVVKMKLDKISASLGIDSWRIKGALDRRTIQVVRDFSPNYMVFKKDLGPIERGTSIFLTEDPVIVRGFPKIKRAFFLRPLVENHFAEKVAVEEKMNGYNVRVFLLNDKLYALTRGGYICPYTTGKLREFPELKKFLSERDFVVCGEAVGTENPYVIHAYEEAKDFGFFCFDIREKTTNNPLPIMERNSLLAAYGIAPVRLLGVFKREEATDRIFQIIRKLEGENREGVVLKDPDMVIPPIKYTPSKTNTSDLTYAFKFPYDYGRDFFFSRIMREGYQALEFKESGDKLEARALRLGRSILYSMIDTMKKILEGETVTEDFHIRVKNDSEIRKISDYLKKQGVNFMVGEVRREGEELVVEIKRLRHASNDKIRATLLGKGE
jgi:putative ATP-dependent DNA ligase